VRKSVRAAAIAVAVAAASAARAARRDANGDLNEEGRARWTPFLFLFFPDDFGHDPRMLPVLLLALIRLAFAIAGLVGALLRGVDAMVALATFGFGIVILLFSVITTRQGMWSGRDVRVQNPLRVAISALYPSSLGLAWLTVFSLVLKPQLAALTSGLLAGLALGAAATAAQIAWARRF
jgi:hypothetical protein